MAGASEFFCHHFGMRASRPDTDNLQVYHVHVYNLRCRRTRWSLMHERRSLPLHYRGLRLGRTWRRSSPRGQVRGNQRFSEHGKCRPWPTPSQPLRVVSRIHQIWFFGGEMSPVIAAWTWLHQFKPSFLLVRFETPRTESEIFSTPLTLKPLNTSW